MVRLILALVVALLVFPGVVDAQGTIFGGAAGGAFIVKDLDGDGKEEVRGVGESLTELGVAFSIAKRWDGEAIALMGQQAGSSNGGGVLWRTFFDAVQGNPVDIGFTVGAFAMGENDAAELEQTTIFLGGGLNARIANATGDRVLAFAEMYASVAGDGAKVLRLGLSGAVN